jgi:hypothetical protein
LAEVTGVTPRQSINIKCRELSSRKALSRAQEDCARCRRDKIVNRLQGAAVPTTPKPVRALPNMADERPWYWEGNVQAKIVEFLIANGCAVKSAANTASKEQGKDIVAQTADKQTLWISVKGFPQKSRYVQARHWFAGALHDLARYRDEDAGALLAMGLPGGFKTYEALLKRNASVRKFLGYTVYWVAEDGAVTVDGAR